MNFCLYNAIKTPDGTVLWCEDGHDCKTHKDKVSGENYMNDGVGYSIRRSVNNVPFEDLSVWSNDPFEKVRTAKFWASYGKDGKSKKRIMALEEMEDSHIRAILETQRQIRGTSIEKLFLKEIEYRITNFKEELEKELVDSEEQKSTVNNKKNKI